MKALSLKQPYAELILQGMKTIELRKWNTSFRGEFFIHASKKPDMEAMSRFGFTALPLGGIVGKAKIVNVINYKNKHLHECDASKHLADSSWGMNGFVLQNPIRVPFKACKGRLNFWNVLANP